MNKKVLVTLGVVFFAVLPAYVSPSSLHILILVFYYAFLGSAWNILSGFTGLFSFGHAAFFGVGAYTTALLYTKFAVSPWFGMIVGGCLAALISLCIGFLCFRYGLKSSYFALGMWGFAEIFRALAANLELVGGPRGILVPLNTSSIMSFQYVSKVPYYYIIFCMTIVIVYVSWLITRSRLGYYFVAIRENEQAAQFLGVDSFKYKIVAMAVSAFFTALGGTFYLQYYLYIDPDLGFGVGVSVEMLLRTIIGGAGTVLGPLVGALILTPVSRLASELFRGYAGVHLMIYGALVIFVILFLPHGVISLPHKLSRITRLFKRA